MARSRLLRLGFVAVTLAVVGAAPALAQAPAKVKIRLDWKGGAQHAPFYLGQQRGIYKQEGIDLEVISGSGSSDTIKQVYSILQISRQSELVLLLRRLATLDKGPD